MKVQTFLAVMPNSCNSVGVGARKGYWDFEHPCMGEIRNFLSNFR